MEDTLARLLKTIQEVHALEKALARKRAQLRRDLRKAYEGGESLAELSRRLGVSRTRVYQLLEDTEEEKE